MAKKVIKVSNPSKCIGCELCVFALGRLKKKVGLSGSEIKILNTEGSYAIHLDPTINELPEASLEKIAKICPRTCFTLEQAGSENAEIKFGGIDEAGN